MTNLKQLARHNNHLTDRRTRVHSWLMRCMFRSGTALAISRELTANRQDISFLLWTRKKRLRINKIRKAIWATYNRLSGSRKVPLRLTPEDDFNRTVGVYRYNCFIEDNTYTTIDLACMLHIQLNSFWYILALKVKIELHPHTNHVSR